MHFPVRKCYHAVKICLLLVLVVSILALFEQWRGGKRSALAQFPISDPHEADYERQILEDEARIIPGLGEGGVAAHLMGEDKRLGEESEKKLAINVHLSERIAYNRSLKDYRNPACERVVYDAELPSASVILIFHNEPYSVVVRTIWSVVNSARRDRAWFKHANFVERDTGRLMTTGYPGQDPSSPFVYLKEIILVDDNSTLPELKGKLSHYVRTRLPPDLIRILRLPDRQGLMIARVQGAKAARGDVLIYLDAHCEVGTDWMRPLLQRIAHKRDAVLTPLIDVLDQSTFQLDAAEQFQVGGFTFVGHFTWIEVPEREKRRRGSDISPTWSPTMAGGLFAINREYYWELGAYDEQMAGWGGENLEMSFRIWQCGGTLETIPCSRVGHVFRSFHPYGLPAQSDTHGINTARMAEVWMDEYAELFYLHRPDLRKNPKIGDVTHRKVLREKLKCKSFQWYLDNIYKEKFVPVRDVYGYGRFSNPATNMCLDTLQRDGSAPLGVYPCHARLQATQYFSLSSRGELRSEETCAELQRARDEPMENGRRVLMAHCHGKLRGQKWVYLPSSQLQHVDTGLCLDAGFEAGADVMARPCKGDAPAQRWRIDYNKDNDFRLNKDEEPSEQEQRLSKLRRQRRISRSLLSYTEDPPPEPSDANATIRRHTHKKKHGKKHGKKRSRKKRTKNKFILKLVRTLANNSEEHLEVDIHCSHKKLYPNNSFVRDLVTVLNDKDIKVINNGRVFERNKVTELVKENRAHHHEVEKVLHKLDIRDPAVDPLAKAIKHARSKKRKHEPVEPIEPIEPVAPEAPDALEAPEAPLEPPAPASAAHKKIIIEDFVEIPPTALTGGDIPPVNLMAMEDPQPQHKPKTSLKKKHRKRKRTRATASTSTASPARELSALGELSAVSAVSAVSAASAVSERTGDAPVREALLRLWNKKRVRDHTDENRMQKVSSDEDSLKVEPPASGEDVPLLSSAETRARDAALPRDRERDSAEDWQIGESRFRASNDTVRRAAPERKEHRHIPAPQMSPRMRIRESRDPPSKHRRDKYEQRTRDTDTNTDTDTDTGDESGASTVGARSRGAESRPVKLVMRSNLTFDLGDEFFAWRSRPDSIADLLGELAIPSNSSQDTPPIHAWVMPPTHATHEALSTGAGMLRSDSDDEDSSSSDSSTDA